MNSEDNKEGDSQKRTSKIYLSIDHLKRGTYNLNITLKDKVIKTIKLKKEL